MKTISTYFTHLSDDQLDKLSQLKELYLEWNNKINVISRKDMDNFYERHVLHSLGIAKIISFSNGSSVLDVGTGGGFPGIPLAILFPNVKFLLVDSIGKKIGVVNEIANALQLSNVIAKQKRAEQVYGSFDFIVSRAVTNLPEFCKWVEKKVKKAQRNSLPNGILSLKGGDLTDELAATTYPHQSYDLQHYFDEPFFETKKIIHVSL